jgi:hypothetical protein
VLGQVSDDLVHAESALMVLPSGEDAQGAELGTEGFFDRPMAALAMRLGWSEDEVGFLWAVVALRVHPRMMVHARSLDETAPRGMSVSLYARMVDLDGEAACHLGLRLLPGHSALRNGLLLPVRGEWVVAAQPGLPSTELIHYLAGFGGTAPGLEVIVAPEHVVLDAEQERTVAQLRSILETPAPFVRYVEGGELTGRRTAVATGTTPRGRAARRGAGDRRLRGAGLRRGRQGCADARVGAAPRSDRSPDRAGDDVARARPRLPAAVGARELVGPRHRDAQRAVAPARRSFARGRSPTTWSPATS